MKNHKTDNSKKPYHKEGEIIAHEEKGLWGLLMSQQEPYQYDTTEPITKETVIKVFSEIYENLPKREDVQKQWLYNIFYT